ncbi:MAG: hypothetical protein AB8U88_04155 [Rickettsia conorii subsp. raoultii]
MDTAVKPRYDIELIY